MVLVAPVVVIIIFVILVIVFVVSLVIPGLLGWLVAIFVMVFLAFLVIPFPRLRFFGGFDLLRGHRARGLDGGRRGQESRRSRRWNDERGSSRRGWHTGGSGRDLG